MSMSLALGVDIGTSGVRCAVLQPDGAQVALSSAAMEEVGRDLRAPAVWRGAMELALSRLWRNVEPDRIGACAVDGTSGTLMALDADGEAAGPVFMYNDPVDDDGIVAAISAAAPRDSAAHGANSGLARALALQKIPGVHRILHQADWIAGLLAGEAVPSDESNALKTGYDALSRRWPDWLGRTG